MKLRQWCYVSSDATVFNENPDGEGAERIVIDEFGEVGEELVRNAMLRTAEVLLTEPSSKIVSSVTGFFVCREATP